MAEFAWSTPHRRIGITELSIIPNELYVEIFSWLCSNPDSFTDEIRTSLRNLLSVCRLFRALSLPLLFEELNLNTSQSSTALASANPTCYAPFFRAVSARNPSALRLAQLVRRIYLDGWLEAGETNLWVYDGFISLFARGIKAMPNITHVKICRSNISKDLLGAILSRKQIQSLTVLYSVMKADLDDAFFDRFAPLSLTHLHHNLRRDDGTMSMPLERFIDHSILKTYRTCRWVGWAPGHGFRNLNINHHTHGFNRRAPRLPDGFRNLEELCIHGFSDVSAFWQALESCHCLKRLEFTPTFQKSEPPRLAPAAIPLLDCLDCPLQYVEQIVPGRPITSYQCSIDSGLWDGPFQRLIDTLNKTTSKIEELHVFGSSLAHECYWKHFPALKKLHIQSRDFNSSLENVLPWPPRSELRELTICINREELDMNGIVRQYNVLHALSKKFPSVDIVTVRPDISWHRDGSSTWTPVAIEGHTMEGWFFPRHDQLVETRRHIKHFLEKHSECGLHTGPQ